MSPHHDTANNYSLAPLADWFQFTSPEVEWDVKFVVGEDVDVYVMEGATTKLLGCICKACSGGSWRHRAQGGTGTWTRGVIAAVRWRCYDIRLHHKLLHAIPASSIRRHGAVFEARQRQLAWALCWRSQALIRGIVRYRLIFYPNSKCPAQPIPACSMCINSRSRFDSRSRRPHLSTTQPCNLRALLYSHSHRDDLITP